MGIALPLALFLLVPPQHCDTLEQAATKALGEAMPLSDTYEYGGVIYEEEGCYRYTKPTSNREKKNLSIRVLIPERSRLAAIYHTHPSSFNDSDVNFSPYDRHLQKQMGIPSFLGVLGLDHMKVLR